MRGSGRKCFGIVPNRITSPVGIWRFFASRSYDIFILLYMSLHCISMSPDSGHYLNEINLAPRYQRLMFPRI